MKGSSTAVKVSQIEYSITCVQPSNGSAAQDDDFMVLHDWCNSNRDYLRSIIYSKGGLLLRGWSIHTVKLAEELIFQVLNFPTMELYPKWFIEFNERAGRLGVPAAGLVQTKLSRNVPTAQKKTMQCPHVEFGAGPSRPRAIGFYCEIVAKSGGETGRIYFPDAIKRLSPKLKEKLDRNGWWNPIAKSVVQPSILIHPETGMETLQLYAYSHRIIPNALKAYEEVRVERPELPEVKEIFYGGKDKYPLILVNEAGKKMKLSDEEMKEIFKAMFSTTEVFDWQKNDLLLFDNVLYGHFRLPGEQPRKLHGKQECFHKCNQF